MALWPWPWHTPVPVLVERLVARAQPRKAVALPLLLAQLHLPPSTPSVSLHSRATQHLYHKAATLNQSNHPSRGADLRARPW